MIIVIQGGLWMPKNLPGKNVNNENKICQIKMSNLLFNAFWIFFSLVASLFTCQNFPSTLLVSVTWQRLVKIYASVNLVVVRSDCSVCSVVAPVLATMCVQPLHTWLTFSPPSSVGFTAEGQGRKLSVAASWPCLLLPHTNKSPFPATNTIEEDWSSLVALNMI